MEEVNKLPSPTPQPKYEAKATLNSLQHDISTSIKPLFNLVFSPLPYDNCTHQDIILKQQCNHPTLGMNLVNCNDRDPPKLKDCQRGTPAAQIPQ